MKISINFINTIMVSFMCMTISSCTFTHDKNDIQSVNPIFKTLITDTLKECLDKKQCLPEPTQSTTHFTIHDDDISEYTCSGTTCYCFRPIFNGSDCRVMRALHCPDTELTPHPGTPGVETCRCENFC